MWKWTDPKNIKVVILDTDSLDKDYLPFPYSQYLPNVQLFFINKNKKRNKIYPIEVKFSNWILNRYIIHTKDKDILCLPIYLIQFISQKKENWNKYNVYKIKI